MWGKAVTGAILAGVCFSMPAVGAAAPFDAVDAYLEQVITDMRLPGLAVAIVQDDQIVYMRGLGRADEAGRPMTPQTPTIIGSVSKPFAAMAALQLAEEGRLDLDAPVEGYLPWVRFSDPQAGQAVTVRRLLTQTSGLNQPDGQITNLGDGTESLEQVMRRAMPFRLHAPVGEQFLYSNLNYALIGLVVEQVSGLDYGTYLKQRLFAPMGMAHSHTSEVEARADGLATGYLPWFGYPVPARAPHLAFSLPDHQLISSAEDLAHLVITQLNGGRFGKNQILSAESVAAMQRPSQPGMGYGMGWSMGVLKDSAAIGHGGDAVQFRSDVIFHPERRYGVVVLANMNGIATAMPALREIGASVAMMMEGRKPYNPGPSYRKMYRRLTAACVGVLLLLVGWVALLVWRGPGLVPGVVSLLLPALLFLAAPVYYRANWPVILRYQPDLGWSGLGLALMLFVTGLVHVLRVAWRSWE